MDGIALVLQARDAGLEVSLDGSHLVVRGPRSAGELARLLLAHKLVVVAALDALDRPPLPALPATQATSPSSQLFWPAWLGDWALLLEPADLPQHAAAYGPMVRDIDPAKYLAWIKAGVLRGTTAPPAAQRETQRQLEFLEILLLRSIAKNC